MDGNPSHFEAIGSRLGFGIAHEDPGKLVLAWRGARFPAFLCFGIAIALSFISVPIVQALQQRGFVGPAGSLWYFPLMNLILLGIAGFLLSVKRTIVIDSSRREVLLAKRSLFRSARVRIIYDEIAAVRLAADRVYSGFALAGSSAAETYPVPSLRLVLRNKETVLLDRGGTKKLQHLATRLGAMLAKPLEENLLERSVMPSETAPDAVD